MSHHNHQSQQSFSLSGAGHQIDNRVGTLNQTVHNHRGESAVEPVYEIKRAWKTRLGSWHFGLVSAVTGVLALIPAYATFAPFVQWASDDRSLRRLPEVDLAWPVGPLVCVGLMLVLLATTWRARRLTKHRLLRLPRWHRLPAVTTIGGRLALVRLGGNCPRCGDRLRYRNRPSRWIEQPGFLGFAAKDVTEREQVAECTANHEHAWKLDPAEDRPGR